MNANRASRQIKALRKRCPQAWSVTGTPLQRALSALMAARAAVTEDAACRALDAAKARVSRMILGH